MSVYCGKCRYIRSFGDCMGGVYYRCKKAPVVEIVKQPTCPYRKHQELADKNKNNDCSDFQHRRWWEILWANDFG